MEYLRAWLTFAGCVALLVCMLGGVMMVKGGTRRSSAPGKGGEGGDKKWKAGFVGGMFLRRKKHDDHAFYEE